MGFNLLLPLIITVAGAFFLIKLRAFFIFHPIRVLKLIISSFEDNSKSALRSLSLALAGTLGVGNIIGVAVGIMIGGAGSVFWLLISSVFAAVLKYSESLLAVENMQKSGERRGGMMYLIKTSFGRASRPLSIVYAIASILLAFVMGAALQSNAIYTAAGYFCDVPKLLIAAAVLTLSFLSVKNGGEMIEKITVVLIPVTTVAYIVMSLFVIFLHIGSLPSVLVEIVNSAFEPFAAGGGIFGFLCSKCLFEGYARGILSNEAGAGTSTLAHAREGSASPCRVGALGMCEVLFDTVILCMLTAFSILLSIENIKEYESAAALVYDAFSSVLSGAFSLPLFLSIISFAFSTVICWYYYGERCSYFVFGGRGRSAYFALFLISVALGVYFNTECVVRLADILLLILSLISVSALIKNSDRVKALSESEKVISKFGFLKGASRHRR